MNWCLKVFLTTGTSVIWSFTTDWVFWCGVEEIFSMLPGLGLSNAIRIGAVDVDGMWSRSVVAGASRSSSWMNLRTNVLLQSEIHTGSSKSSYLNGACAMKCCALAM